MMWYYGDQGEQMGPISDADLRSLIRKGAVSDDTPIWRAGMACWASAGTVPGLFSPPPLPEAATRDNDRPTTAPKTELQTQRPGSSMAVPTGQSVQETTPRRQRESLSRNKYKVTFEAGHESPAATASHLQYWFESGDITPESPVLLIDTNLASTVGKIFDLETWQELSHVKQSRATADFEDHSSDRRASPGRTDAVCPKSGARTRNPAAVAVSIAIMAAAIFFGFWAGALAVLAWARLFGGEWTDYRTIQGTVWIAVIVFAWKTLTGTMALTSDEGLPFSTSVTRSVVSGAIFASGWIAGGVILTLIW